MNTFLIFNIFTLYYLKELKIKLLDSNTRVIIIYILYQKKKKYTFIYEEKCTTSEIIINIPRFSFPL